MYPLLPIIIFLGYSLLLYLPKGINIWSAATLTILFALYMYFAYPRQRALHAITKAYKNGDPLQGKIKGEINGGYAVQVKGLSCYCPASSLNKFSKNPEEIRNKDFLFYVASCDDIKHIVVQPATQRATPTT